VHGVGVGVQRDLPPPMQRGVDGVEILALRIAWDSWAYSVSGTVIVAQSDCRP
jgi:hypothetical protein